MNEINVYIGGQIRKYRKVCRMTLQQLGRACGIAVPAAAVAVLNG